MTKKCKVCNSECDSEDRFCSHCGTEFPKHLEGFDTYDAFISYRREGGSEIAALLKIQLEGTFKKRVFLDVDTLGSGRFDERLLDVIGRTPNFILVLSAGCLQRCADRNDWLRREIVHAFAAQRVIIPVRVDGFTFPSEAEMGSLPDSVRMLANLQGVPYNLQHRDSAIRKLAGYLASSIPSNAAPPKRAKRNDRLRTRKPLSLMVEKADSHSTDNSVAREMRDRMVTIRPGEFLMGNHQTGQVWVEISRPFMMDKYQLTKRIHLEVSSDNPPTLSDSEGNQPISNISWVQAVEFCNRLSLASGLEPVYQIADREVAADLQKGGYRLPTEAEWEYACVAGSREDLYGPIDEIAWYNRNSGGQIRAAGLKTPNSFGLYDMLGNVWEWCHDWFQKKHPIIRQVDYAGPVLGVERVIRGGSWNDLPGSVRARARFRKTPLSRESTLGFRVVRRP